MTTPTSGVTLTLPGPSITATVSWEQVRAYLTRSGWDLPAGQTHWWQRGKGGEYVWAPPDKQGDADDMSDTIRTLARLVSVSSGEMLQRIAVAT